MKRSSAAFSVFEGDAPLAQIPIGTASGAASEMDTGLLVLCSPSTPDPSNLMEQYFPERPFSGIYVNGQEWEINNIKLGYAISSVDVDMILDQDSTTVW